MLPTPNTMDFMPPKSKEVMDRHYRTVRKGRSAPCNLREAVHPELYPSPRSSRGEMLPTPDTQNRTSAKMIKGKCPGRKYRTSLGLEQVAEISSGIMPKEMDSLEDTPVFKHLWPSPRANSGTGDCEHGEGGQDLQTAIKLLPTPRASEYKGVGPLGSKSHKHMLDRDYLNAVIQENTGVSGQLNPDWVEVLMGWPPGWTSLDPLPLEVWNMWQDNFLFFWWPFRRPTVWHCMELKYPSLTTTKENRTNRLKAIGNGQVPQSKIMAFSDLTGAEK